MGRQRAGMVVTHPAVAESDSQLLQYNGDLMCVTAPLVRSYNLFM